MAAAGFGYTTHILEGTECHHSQHLHLVHNMGRRHGREFLWYFPHLDSLLLPFEVEHQRGGGRKHAAAARGRTIFHRGYNSNILRRWTPDAELPFSFSSLSDEISRRLQNCNKFNSETNKILQNIRGLQALCI